LDCQTNARNSTGSGVVERAAVWDKPRSGLSSVAVLRRMKERDRMADIRFVSVSISVNPWLKLFLRFA
jgi:hypothetical protein